MGSARAPRAVFRALAENPLAVNRAGSASLRTGPECVCEGARRTCARVSP